MSSSTAGSKRPSRTMWKVARPASRRWRSSPSPARSRGARSILSGSRPATARAPGSCDPSRIEDRRPRRVPRRTDIGCTHHDDGRGPPRAEEGPAAQPRPLPTIAGFQIVREIGRGGMGVVYEAIELALGRRSALKVLLSHRGPTAAVERFHREACAAAGLHHANIVPVFGVGEDEGQLYYVDAVHRERGPSPGLRPSVHGDAGERRSAGDRFLPRHALRRGPLPRLLPHHRPHRPRRLPRRWPTPTSGASSIATSSPPTSCSTPRVTSGSPISAWPRRSRKKTD